ncbi:MAG: glycerol-3-phosphate dehydrogenase C-terminal domain-containing protein, partial [Planctomycetota bacterium]
LLAEPPRRADVRFAFAGWRALPARKGPPGALHREAFVVPERIPTGGTLHTIVGGKLTTHRSLAERCVNALFGHRTPSPTRQQALPGGDGPREVTDPLWWRHGSRASLVRGLLRGEPAFARPICPHRPFLVAELAHALRHDGACTFADVMLRRLVHDHGPCLEAACLREAHGWFLRARTWPVDDDATQAADALRAEVAVMTGERSTVRTP